jgi:hypothetical protein
MQISERELRSLTRSLDELHQETFPAATASIADFGDRLARAAATRRRFLMGGAALVGTGVLAACGGSSGGKPSAMPSAGSIYTGDLKVVALAAALENLAVAAYTLALTEAGKGTYGKVPPAIGAFITTAKSQHQQHGAAWNAVLKNAGKPAVTGTPLTITQGAVNQLRAAKSVPAVATVALDLETSAAQTYTFATANVTDMGGITTAATIAPVEAMHAAILSFVLGKYPVPDGFIGVDKAVRPSALTV